MPDRIHTYDGEALTVRYDVTRCIHSGECVRALKLVFDPKRSPWINPSAAAPDEIAQAVQRCPSGALSCERRDGGAAERAPARNVVWVIPSGPLHVRGTLRLTTPAGDQRELRVLLCRCGNSANKPFCDGAHSRTSFRDPGSLGASGLSDGHTDESGQLEVRPAPNGPLLLKGPFEIAGADFRTRSHGSSAALCRCGHSKNKPFCDGAHAAAGFEDGIRSPKD